MRAREREFLLVPPFALAVAVADEEFYGRLLHHAVVFALEPAVEEAELILPSILLLGRSAENSTGVRWVAVLSAICMAAAFVMLYFLYDEKKILGSLKKYCYE